MSAIVWVSVVIHKSGQMPDLTGAAVFAGAGAGHGLVGKWSEIARAKLNLNNGSAIPESECEQPKG